MIPDAGSNTRQLCNSRQHQTWKYLQVLEGGELLSGSHRGFMMRHCWCRRVLAPIMSLASWHMKWHFLLLGHTRVYEFTCPLYQSTNFFGHALAMCPPREDACNKICKTLHGLGPTLGLPAYLAEHHQIAQCPLAGVVCRVDTWMLQERKHAVQVPLKLVQHLLHVVIVTTTCIAIPVKHVLHGAVHRMPQLRRARLLRGQQFCPLKHPLVVLVELPPPPDWLNY